MGLRNTFTTLRSFSLSPSTIQPTSPTSPTKEASLSPQGDVNGRERLDNIASRGITIVVLATLVSLIFISTIAIALVGRNSDAQDQFATALNEVSRFNPGVVLVGEDVDVDIDEPSVTIRWSVIACGNPFMLPRSKGLLGNSACGLPSDALDIFVDSNPIPSMQYNPTHIPLDESTGQRKSIESAYRFETSHILDVHEARQYPFDTYRVQTDFRASPLLTVNQSNPMLISRVLAIDITSSFNIKTTDSRSYLSLDGGQARIPGQRFEMYIRRPGSARLFTMLLFTVSWLLTHINIGQLFIIKKGASTKVLACCVAISGGTLLALPQIRKTMPDAPGLDGVLIDCIGFFPQMGIVGLCTVALLLVLAVREIDFLREQRLEQHRPLLRKFRLSDAPVPSPRRPRRPPPMYTIDSSPLAVDLNRWETQRKVKHLRGEYVFPPVSETDSTRSTGTWKPFHRRSKTAIAITMLEDGDISKWSDHEE